jgi:NADP-dependent 3-hydroxy acid dehydrogenase YdfG
VQAVESEEPLPHGTYSQGFCRFLNEGAYVALCGRDLDTLNELGKQFPNQALVVQCDLGTDAGQYVFIIKIIIQ